MAYPRLALDAKGAAVSGGAAIATAGLSIVAEGMWDRWVTTAKNPCDRVLSEASKQDKSAYNKLLQASSISNASP